MSMDVEVKFQFTIPLFVEAMYSCGYGCMLALSGWYSHVVYNMECVSTGVLHTIHRVTVYTPLPCGAVCTSEVMHQVALFVQVLAVQISSYCLKLSSIFSSYDSNINPINIVIMPLLCVCKTESQYVGLCPGMQPVCRTKSQYVGLSFSMQK